MGEGHGKVVDWWSLGILLYEMFNGSPPFQNANKNMLMISIISKSVNFNKIDNASASFKDLIKRLLVIDPSKRLGGSHNGASEIKRHPFFNNIDWDKMSKRECTPPVKPNLSSCYDLNNICNEFLRENPIDTPVE